MRFRLKRRAAAATVLNEHQQETVNHQNIACVGECKQIVSTPGQAPASSRQVPQITWKRMNPASLIQEMTEAHWPTKAQ
jgi:hypothetical protein